MRLQTDTPRAPRPPEDSPDGGYRPHLDGLRTVAVYLAVLGSAGSSRFVGGFVGVDVLFVLSGFLVTQLLIRDVGAPRAASLLRFYARRVRRLLPALWVTVLVTALVFSAVASPAEVVGAEDGFRAAFLSYANWHLIALPGDLFGGDASSSSPVLHLWSPAVGQQLLLVWPLLVGALVARRRRADALDWRSTRRVVAVGALASLGWAWWLRSSNLDHAVFGSEARAYQLLAGALLALAPGAMAWLQRFSRMAQLASAASLVLLVITASSWWDLDPVERGVAATVLTVIAIASLGATPAGASTRILSSGPLVHLGRISYGTYLWHWPVLVVMAKTFDLGPTSTIAFAVLIATALASLSFELLERRVRTSTWLDRHPREVIAAGVALSVAAALVVVPITGRGAERTTAVVAAPARPAAGGAGSPGATPVPAGIDFEAIRTDYPQILSCVDQSVADCTLVEGTGLRVLLMGDSHAAMYVPVIEAIAEREDMTLAMSELGGCPWQRGLHRVPESRLGLPLPVGVCKTHQDDTYDRLIPAFDPDLVVVASLDYPARGLEYVGPDGEPLALGSPEADELVQELTRASLAELRRDGRRVLLVEPTPLTPLPADRSVLRLNPVACLSTATVIEECRYVVDPGPSSLERLYRRIDDDDDRVWSLDVDRLVCPYLPICDPILDGHVVQIDGEHLTSGFASSLIPPISAYLRDNGILSP